MPKFISDKQMMELEAKQPKFISDADMAKMEKPADAVLSKQGLLSGIQGLGQAATFGHLPQLQAAAEPLVFGALNKLTGKEVPSEGGYVERRDRYARALEESQKAQPFTYGAGTLAGTLASAVMPAGLIGTAGRGAGTVAKIGRAAFGGAAAGALESPGITPGEAPGLDLEKRATQAGFGAATGGLLEGGVLGIQKGVKALKAAPGKLREISDLMAYRGLGRATKKQIQNEIKQAGGTSGIREVGKFARERGLVRGGEDIDEIFNKVKLDKEKTGKQIGLLYEGVAKNLGKVDPKLLSKEAKEAVKATNLNPSQISNEIASKIKEKWLGTPAGDQAMKAVKGVLSNLQAKGDMPIGIQELHKFRQGLDDIIYDKTTDNIRKQAMVDVRRLIQESIDKRIDVADKLFKNESTAALKELNKDYKLLSKAGDLATGEMARQASNRVFSLTDQLMGLGVLTSQAPSMLQSPEQAAKGLLLAGGAAVGSKAIRQYGTPLLMRGTEATGRTIQELGALVKENLKSMPMSSFISKMYKRYGKEKTNQLLNNPAFIGALGGEAQGQ